MPRAPRLQFEGAFYHVYHRGNRREPIFWDDQDYFRFEAVMLEAIAEQLGKCRKRHDRTSPPLL